MWRALERGVWPGVAGCLSVRAAYDQFLFSRSATALALVTFAVEKNRPCVACPFGIPPLSPRELLAKRREASTRGGEQEQVAKPVVVDALQLGLQRRRNGPEA